MLPGSAPAELIVTDDAQRLAFDDVDRFVLVSPDSAFLDPEEPEALEAFAPPLDFARMDVTPKRIAEGFYVIDETPAHGGAISVLTGPDGTVIVDTGVPGLAAMVEAEIRKLSGGKPVRYVINTHAHVE